MSRRLVVGSIILGLMLAIGAFVMSVVALSQRPVNALHTASASSSPSPYSVLRRFVCAPDAGITTIYVGGGDGGIDRTTSAPAPRFHYDKYTMYNMSICDGDLPAQAAIQAKDAGGAVPPGRPDHTVTVSAS